MPSPSRHDVADRIVASQLDAQADRLVAARRLRIGLVLQRRAGREPDDVVREQLVECDPLARRDRMRLRRDHDEPVRIARLRMKSPSRLGRGEDADLTASVGNAPHARIAERLVQLDADSWMRTERIAS
jgi:hypothetical protein